MSRIAKCELVPENHVLLVRPGSIGLVWICRSNGTAATLGKRRACRQFETVFQVSRETFWWVKGSVTVAIRRFPVRKSNGVRHTIDGWADWRTGHLERLRLCLLKALKVPINYWICGDSRQTPCSFMLVHVAKPTLSEISLQYRDCKVLAIWPFAEPQDRYRFTWNRNPNQSSLDLPQ